jgi:signal transduction histidine kinase
VIKHARASYLLLRLSYDPVVCRLTIEDDGVGFDLEQIGPYGGFGLKSMRSRLKEIKGRMDIVTGPGSGTILNIEVPYE